LNHSHRVEPTGGGTCQSPTESSYIARTLKNPNARPPPKPEHARTGQMNCTALLLCATVVPTTFGIDVKQNVNVFKVGVNLKFAGW